MTYGIFDKNDGRRLGSVWKVIGEPPKTRWQAFASGERRKGFPSLKAATAWLRALDDEDKEKRAHEPR
jgi:hypothetical protein